MAIDILRRGLTILILREDQSLTSHLFHITKESNLQWYETNKPLSVTTLRIDQGLEITPFKAMSMICGSKYSSLRTM